MNQCVEAIGTNLGLQLVPQHVAFQQRVLELLFVDGHVGVGSVKRILFYRKQSVPIN